MAPDLHDGAAASSVGEAKEPLSRVDGESRKSIVLGAVDFLRSQPALSERCGSGGSFLWNRARDFPKTRASFLGHYAPEDEWEPMDGIRELENKLREAGREVTFHFYPGTKHWFFEENRPGDYDPAASSLAWSRTLVFLNRTLK